MPRGLLSRQAVREAEPVLEFHVDSLSRQVAKEAELVLDMPRGLYQLIGTPQQ